MPRRFAIFQFPNRPLLVSMAASATARVSSGDTARAAGLVADVALLIWAYDEIVDGASWFRRLLGLGGAAVAVRELMTD
jgi:hypothetical protein